MLIGIYLLLAVFVVLLSLKLSVYVDLLDKKTDLSGAFIGGVILAAVTSLPEFFTSLSATVILDEPGLVIGNILGSNIFNLSAMALIILMFFKTFRAAKIGKSHKTTLSCTLLIYVMLLLGVFLKADPHILTISIYSIAIAVVYYIGIKTMSSDDGLEGVEDEVDSPLTIAQIGRRFLLCSILLVVASVLVTYVTDMLAKQYNIGTTFAGALLLGIATSLPELSSSINLAKLGNFNAMTGNILGSNLFNFFILTVADISYFKSTIFSLTPETVSLLFFGFIAHIALAFVIIYKTSIPVTEQEKKKLVFIIPNIVVILCYAMFVVTSM